LNATRAKSLFRVNPRNCLARLVFFQAPAKTDGGVGPDGADFGRP